LQQQILEATSNLSTASPALNALLMTIYASAVLSMSEDACMGIMNEQKSKLIARYIAGAQYALREVGFLESTNFVVLQAFVLYLVSDQGFGLSFLYGFLTCSVCHDEHSSSSSIVLLQWNCWTYW
jgi:hypothetical protein